MKLKNICLYMLMFIFGMVGVAFAGATKNPAIGIGIGSAATWLIFVFGTAGESELLADVFTSVLTDKGYAFDNIFSRVALIKYLLLKDSKDGSMLGPNARVRQHDGGNQIEIPIEYAVGDSMVFYDGMDKVTFTVKETETNAKYDWKFAVQPLLVKNADMLEIKGKQLKIENFVRAKLRNMNKSMITSINSAFLNLSPGSKDYHSVPFLVDYAPTVSKSVGGLDQSTYTWWRNKTSASTAATLAAWMAEIDDLFMSIGGSMSEDMPDIILTDDKIYKMAIIYARLKGTHTFVQSEIDQVFNLGGKSLTINGAALIWDSGVSEPVSEAAHSAMYPLNTDYLQFNTHKDRTFELTGPQDQRMISGQDATAWAVWLMGNLTCSNRSKNGVLYSIDNTLVA